MQFRCWKILSTSDEMLLGHRHLAEMAADSPWGKLERLGLDVTEFPCGGPSPNQDLLILPSSLFLQSSPRTDLLHFQASGYKTRETTFWQVKVRATSIAEPQHKSVKQCFSSLWVLTLLWTCLSHWRSALQSEIISIKREVLFSFIPLNVRKNKDQVPGLPDFHFSNSLSISLPQFYGNQVGISLTHEHNQDLELFILIRSWRWWELPISLYCCQQISSHLHSGRDLPSGKVTDSWNSSAVWNELKYELFHIVMYVLISIKGHYQKSHRPRRGLQYMSVWW